jgi:hypothetical protein
VSDECGMCSKTFAHLSKLNRAHKQADAAAQDAADEQEPANDSADAAAAEGEGEGEEEAAAAGEGEGEGEAEGEGEGEEQEASAGEGEAQGDGESESEEEEEETVRAATPPAASAAGSAEPAWTNIIPRKGRVAPARVGLDFSAAKQLAAGRSGPLGRGSARAKLEPRAPLPHADDTKLVPLKKDTDTTLLLGKPDSEAAATAAATSASTPSAAAAAAAPATPTDEVCSLLLLLLLLPPLSHSQRHDLWLCVWVQPPSETPKALTKQQRKALRAAESEAKLLAAQEKARAEQQAKQPQSQPLKDQRDNKHSSNSAINTSEWPSLSNKLQVVKPPNYGHKSGGAGGSGELRVSAPAKLDSILSALSQLTLTAPVKHKLQCLSMVCAARCLSSIHRSIL